MYKNRSRFMLLFYFLSLAIYDFILIRDDTSRGLVIHLENQLHMSQTGAEAAAMIGTLLMSYLVLLIIFVIVRLLIEWITEERSSEVNGRIFNTLILSVTVANAVAIVLSGSFDLDIIAIVHPAVVLITFDILFYSEKNSNKVNLYTIMIVSIIYFINFLSSLITVIN
ncbi:hypothetical protein [Companilactobacillus metriopterae]|uniref:hypothetical protein n=1 Tax=Companilactobacillus metriopterae TaxID=1909267 RepID=UPI00100B490E|nr:hypothetical protein [Companilactobacillus metriopterae]